MTNQIEISEVMANAKNIARKEFGEEVVATHPGIAALEQAKAIEKLGKDICAAAAHARGE
ncbi:MAG: hypothetical protein ABSA97_11645 [Verrucomicrobiia bacterium]